MSGQPTKPGNYGGDMIIIAKKRGSCGSCQHFCADGSCAIHPIVIKEVGTNYWRTCTDYLLRNTNVSVPHVHIESSEQKKISETVAPCANSRLINEKRICKRRCAPHYGRTCYQCIYYEKPYIVKTTIPQKHTKESWKETERQALKNLKRLRAQMDKEDKQCKLIESVKEKTIVNEVGAIVVEKESPEVNKCKATDKHKDKKQSKILPAKVGCIYLKNDICMVKGTPCAHGDKHCLFFKTK